MASLTSLACISCILSNLLCCTALAAFLALLRGCHAPPPLSPPAAEEDVLIDPSLEAAAGILSFSGGGVDVESAGAGAGADSNGNGSDSDDAFLGSSF